MGLKCSIYKSVFIFEKQWNRETGSKHTRINRDWALAHAARSTKTGNRWATAFSEMHRIQTGIRWAKCPHRNMSRDLMNKDTQNVQAVRPSHDKGPEHTWLEGATQNNHTNYKEAQRPHKAPSKSPSQRPLWGTDNAPDDTHKVQSSRGLHEPNTQGLRAADFHSIGGFDLQA